MPFIAPRLASKQVEEIWRQAADAVQEDSETSEYDDEEKPEKKDPIGTNGRSRT
jgi:hypothetical protein